MPTFRRLKIQYGTQIHNALEPGFEQDLFKATLENLRAHSALCFNNFAYSLRELIRHILHRLSPSHDVKACSWYKPHRNGSSTITRGQRAKYAIQGGLSDRYVSKVLGFDTKHAVGNLINAIDALSKHTHIEQSTFAIPRTTVLTLAEECLIATLYFVDHISEFRTRVIEAVESSINTHLLDAALSETIIALDELATHHCIEGVYTYEFKINNIDSHNIRLTAQGSVSVTLQYGSGSDMRHGIGTEISESFPFHAKVSVLLKRPLGKYATVSDLHVDTRSWYE